MKKLISSITKVTALILLLSAASCLESTLQPTEPFFSDVLKITITSSSFGDSLQASNGYITLDYKKSDDIKTVVVGLFTKNSILVNENNELDNTGLLAGVRTGRGLNNKSIVNISDLLIFDQNTQDFIAASNYNGTGTENYDFGAWAYDQNGVLTHGSPPYDVDIVW